MPFRPLTEKAKSGFGTASEGDIVALHGPLICCLGEQVRLKALVQRKVRRWPTITRLMTMSTTSCRGRRAARTPALPHQEQDRKRRARGARATDQPAGLIRPLFGFVRFAPAGGFG